jgi:hypothetical protein
MWLYGFLIFRHDVLQVSPGARLQEDLRAPPSHSRASWEVDQGEIQVCQDESGKAKQLGQGGSGRVSTMCIHTFFIHS